MPIYDEKLGIGWGDSLLGVLRLAITPVPWVFRQYGELIRMRWPVELTTFRTRSEACWD